MDIRGRTGFGAAGLGNLLGVISDDDAARLCAEAWEQGVRYYDSAPHYGLGLSERRLGAFLREKPRGEFVVSTKVGRVLEGTANPGGTLDLENGFHVPANYRRVLDYTPAGVRRSIEDSLERLGLEHIDIAYVHDPEHAPEGTRRALETSLNGLAELKAEGIVGATGVGTMSTAALEAAVDVGGLDLLLVAGRYTLLEQPAAHVLDACASQGVQVVAASVFNSGLLARATPSPDGIYEYGPVPKRLYEKAVAIAEICTRHGVDLPTAALHFPLLHPAVVAILPGANAPGQMSQNIARLAAPVPGALWDDLRGAGLIPAQPWSPK